MLTSRYLLMFRGNVLPPSSCTTVRKAQLC